MTAEPTTGQVETNLPEPHTPYEHALHAFLEDFFEVYPVAGTSIGYHRHDGEWGDPSEEGRLARIEMLRGHREAILAFDDAELSPAERIDRGLLDESIESMLFSEDVLREGAWDPLGVVYVLGSGLFSLLAREFAPWQHRGEALLSRIGQIPEVLDHARRGLTGLPGRPVSTVHTETAIAQLSGDRRPGGRGAAEARGRAQGEADGLPAHLETAGAAAKEALTAFRVALEGEIRDRAEGDGRLGAELFGQKLRFTLASDLSADELLERARRDYTAVRGEMVRIAREAWSTWVPDRPMPDAALATRSRRTPSSSRCWMPSPTSTASRTSCSSGARRRSSGSRTFCRANDVIGLAEEPLKLTWTPVFMRAYGRAFLDAPGPLDKGLSSHFWITPPDESLGEEATESYLREDNDRMLRLLCIHEGVPGHYLQLAWSNRSHSLTRTIFTSGMFAEGWAVYVTQVMMDLGYGDHEPALLLNHYKFYLRAVINAILDVAIHTQGMTEAEALT